MEPTLLLVDDEPDIREVLDIYLTELGYTVHTAENGEKALDVFHRTVPSIVLSDIKMPGMNGIELLRRIKQESPETEVIMITGHGDMDLAIDSLKLEATDFITKPVNDDILEIALQRAGERIEMRRRLRAYTENLEQMVEEKTHQLLESEKLAAVGRVAAELSHTIKNIAGALKGGIYVLGRGIEDDNHEYLQRGWEMVRGNVDKIKNLAMDLLDFGKAGNLRFQEDSPLRAVSEALELYRPVEVFSWFNITLAHNYGAAFSFLANAGGWQRWFFVVLAIVVSIVLLVWLIRLPRREWLSGLGLGLILGGAVGNVADRIRLGYVVDFIDVHWAGWHYPAFNVADSAITCGVALLLLDMILVGRRDKEAK